jgi:hypothetical protein
LIGPHYETYIVGNPPYLGSGRGNTAQKEDMRLVLGHIKKHKLLDYISIWFYKAAIYITQHPHAATALVSTNSICQGEQVAVLWPRLFQQGVRIGFAHESFKWTNHAKGNAGVTCIIVGLTPRPGKARLYTTDHVREVSILNGYLAEGKPVYVHSVSKPINGLPPLTKGSMPTEGKDPITKKGNLTLDPEDRIALLQSYPEAAPFIKRFVGAEELLKGIERYCLWIPDEHAQDAWEIPPIAQRLARVKESRQQSTDVGTRKWAQRPHAFSRRRYRPEPAVVIPRHTSDRREYVPIGYVDKDTIISDAAFAGYGVAPYGFGLLSCRLHNVWLRAVGGRLGSGYRYSSDLVYNTFPVPPLTKSQKMRIQDKAHYVLHVRENYYEKTLSETYDPDKMPDDLRQAHRDLDEAVERCYRSKAFKDDADRLAHLFERYEHMLQEVPA